MASPYPPQSPEGFPPPSRVLIIPVNSPDRPASAPPASSSSPPSSRNSSWQSDTTLADNSDAPYHARRSSSSAEEDGDDDEDRSRLTVGTDDERRRHRRSVSAFPWRDDAKGHIRGRSRGSERTKDCEWGTASDEGRKGGREATRRGRGGQRTVLGGFEGNVVKIDRWHRKQVMLMVAGFLGVAWVVVQVHASSARPIASHFRSALLSSYLASSSSGSTDASVLSLQRGFSPTDHDRTAVRMGDHLVQSSHHCDYCDCKVDASHPPLKDPVSGKGGKGGRDLIPKVLWSGIRDIYCRRVYIPWGSTVQLLRQSTLTSPSLVTTMQWNLTSTELGLPTAYIFTKTSASGRTGPAREGYFRRHLNVLRNHALEMRNEGWPAESAGILGNGYKRQFIWIIVEDDDKLSEDISELLASSDIPYIYFAFGPTRHFGNAQQNAAYSLIHKLSSPTDGLFGHGPVLSVDDDASVIAELFKMIWKVRRIGVWPMGNLGPTHWEGPVYDDTGKFVKWVAGATSKRPFPIDNGAFAFRSELFGKEIKGPKFWGTNMMGGEVRLLLPVTRHRSALLQLVRRPLFACGWILDRSLTMVHSGSHVAWHNQPLPLHCIDEACD